MMQSHLLQTQGMTYRQRLRRVRSPLKALCWFFVLLFISLPSVSFSGTFVALGPEDYTRSTGDPVSVIKSFTVLDPSTTYTLQIYNGGLVDGEFEKVSSSVITLNGVQIVGPNEFNQNVTLIEKPVTLAASNQLSVELRGRPGGGITLQIIGVDNDPPTITASVNPSSNAAGWNNSSVTVSFTCSDATSGIASCPNPMSVSTEGANQVVSGTAVDRAGNTASTSVTLNIDKTPPTLSPTVTPQPNLAGWNRTDVTVSFTCTDAISGIAVCPSPVTVNAEGANQLISSTATDLAGNSATASLTVNLDKSVPTIGATVNPAANAAGWHKSNPTVNFTCSDAISGIAVCPSSVTVNVEGANQLISRTTTDRAGNSAIASLTISLDKTAPSLAIASPSDGASVTSSPVTVSGTASDSLSGLASVLCNGSSASLSNSNFACDVPLNDGPNAITVEATDVADNMSSSSRTVLLDQSQNEPGPKYGINAQANLFGENVGDFIILQWALNDNATEYFVYRSTSLNGPWEQTGRFSQGAASTGGAKVHETPDARLMDLCFKVEAIDATGLVIEFYEPICVPKFVP